MTSSKFMGRIAVLTVGLAVAVLGLLQPGSPALAAVPSGSVDMGVEVDHRVIKARTEQPVYVLIQFQGAHAPKAANRPSINLALVLDRSGSMDEKGKIAYLKKAAKLVVDSLEPTDRLAVVEYDDKITVLWPSTPVESPAMIKRRIDSLSPRGRTNLSGGMMEGVKEVRQHLAQEAVNRVILLSDGLANEGVTRPAEIRRLVAKAKAGGVAISSMGLGSNYNEDLMQDIAQYGGGNYYFIENPNQISRIFQEEMDILFTSVATGAEMVFAPSAVVRQVEVFGYKTKTASGRTTVPLGGFYSEENRSLLLRLVVAPSEPGTIDLGRLEFTYRDTKANSHRRVTADLTVSASTDKKLILASKSKKVAAEAALIETDRRHEAAVRLFQEGRHKEARERLTQLAGDVDSAGRELGDERLARKAEALRLESEEMEEVAAPGAAPQASAAYVKRSKQRLYQAQQGKRGKYLLQEGETGADVERLQEALKKSGFYKGDVDGVFDPEVSEALKKYQADQGLTADGVAGAKTLKALGLY